MANFQTIVQKTAKQDAKCKNCGKIGHYYYVCKASKTHTLSQVQNDSDTEWLYLECFTVDIVTTRCQNSHVDPWWVTLQVDRIPLRFKLDTGADVTAILYRLFATRLKKRLEKSDKCLKELSLQSLNVRGQFKCSLGRRSKKYQEKSTY